MKKFLIEILFFKISVVIFLTPLIFLHHKNTQNPIINIQRSHFNCEKTIFLGSSDARDAFSPDIRDDLYNLSSGGFKLSESYKELKETILSKCVPNNVIISFFLGSLRSTNDLPVKTNVRFNPLRHNNPIINFFTDESRLKHINFNFKNEIIPRHYSKKRSTKNIKMLSKKGFLSHANNLSNKMYGLDYLKKIIELKKEFGFRLIFISTPRVPEYSFLLKNNEYWTEDQNFMYNQMQNNIIEYYDHTDWFNDKVNLYSYFTDHSHLTKDGSVVYTQELLNKLKIK